MVQVTRHNSNTGNYDSVNINEITDIISMTEEGDMCIIDGTQYEPRTLEHYANCHGLKVEVLPNLYGDHTVTFEGYSVRKAILANLKTSDRGEAVVRINSKLNIAGIRTQVSTLSKQQGAKMSMHMESPHLIRLIWRPRGEGHLSTRQWVLKTIHEIPVQGEYNFDGIDGVSKQTLYNACAATDYILTVKNMTVTKKRAKVKKYLGTYYLVVGSKYNRVLPLPRTHSCKHIDSTDETRITEWFKANEPNFHHYYVSENLVTYQQPHNPPPPLPTLEK